MKYLRNILYIKDPYAEDLFLVHKNYFSPLLFSVPHSILQVTDFLACFFSSYDENF